MVGDLMRRGRRGEGEGEKRSARCGTSQCSSPNALGAEKRNQALVGSLILQRVNSLGCFAAIRGGRSACARARTAAERLDVGRRALDGANEGLQHAHEMRKTDKRRKR